MKSNQFIPTLTRDHFKKLLLVFSLFCSLVLLSTQSLAQDGIASRYPGDLGIANDPDVIFSENFEEGTLKDVVKRWTDQKNVKGMSLVLDTPANSGGKHALLITSLGGANTGGYLYKKLSKGYNQLYFRYYIKYGRDGTFHHTRGALGGYNPPTNWPQGGAGSRPTGRDSFSIGAEPVSSSFRFDFYVYWMHMRTNPDKRYWGNDFIQEKDLKLPRGKWVCIEVMVKMNNPVDAYNGELALWIDGDKIIHLKQGSPKGRWIWDSFHPRFNGTPFEGFQWRKDGKLNINWIWLLNYATKNPPGLIGEVWFDDVVVAKKYIGPIKAIKNK